jgi:hypothetical protein
MSDKKKHDEQKQQDAKDPANHEGNLADFDPDKAQNDVDVEAAAEQANQVSPPHRDDEQHPKQGIPPGQENVPKGFTSARGMQGGSANRRKR